MNAFREISVGILFALVSILVITSAFSLSFAENIPTPTQVNTEELFSNPPVFASQEYSPSPSPISETPEPTQTASPTSLPSPTVCPPPEGWQSYTIQPGDSTDTLAQAYSLSIEELKTANCLISDSLIPGTILFIPPSVISSATPMPPTPIPCGPPTGWIAYTVQPADTLSLMGVYFGVRVRDLQNANCLGNSTLILTGQILYVPSYPIFLPTQIPPTLTPTIVVETETPFPSDTPVLNPTDLFTSIPSDIPAESSTPDPAVPVTP